MTDLDFIFTELYNLNSRLYSLETTHITKEYNTHMVKILNYELTVSNGAITVTPPADTTVSQFQEVIIRATVAGLIGTKKTVKLSISSPTFATGVTEEAPSDFEFTMHMIPSTGTLESFELRLNEFLGAKLVIGSLNECPILFSIIDSNGAEYLGDLNSSISLYKTNTDLTFEPSNISNIFIKMTDLEKRLSELEA